MVKKKTFDVGCIVKWVVKIDKMVCWDIWGCLISVSKQQFSVFKQHFTYFHTLFHSHVFPQKF